jgi:hypothetical protein
MMKVVKTFKEHTFVDLLELDPYADAGAYESIIEILKTNNFISEQIKSLSNVYYNYIGQEYAGKGDFKDNATIDAAPYKYF